MDYSVEGDKSIPIAKSLVIDDLAKSDGLKDSSSSKKSKRRRKLTQEELERDDPQICDLSSEGEGVSSI